MFRHALIPASRYYRGFFNNIFDEGFRELQKLERHLGELQLNMHADSNKDLTYRCSVAGYHPEELKVDIKGNELIIQGEHKSSGDGQTLQRSFTRCFSLPPSVDKEAIRCSLNEKGELEILAPKIFIEDSKSQSIPIDFKSSSSKDNTTIDSKKNSNSN